MTLGDLARLLARLSTPARALLLGALVSVALVAAFALDVPNVLLSALFLSAPLLAWFTIEPEPKPASIPPARGDFHALARFPFLPGGASGAALFVLCLAAVDALLLLRIQTHGHVGEVRSTQILIGTLYACVYVLIPVGLCSPVLRWWWGRVLATAVCLSSYWVLRALFPTGGPREPNRLTEFGDPWEMGRTVIGTGVIHYARDDLAMLSALAAAGVLLNVPRVWLRWRALRV